MAQAAERILSAEEYLSWERRHPRLCAIEIQVSELYLKVFRPAAAG